MKKGVCVCACSHVRKLIARLGGQQKESGFGKLMKWRVINFEFIINISIPWFLNHLVDFTELCVD